MPALPTGTLTFVFTDIEGSTRLWEQSPEEMLQAHARHGALIVACVERHGGTFVRTRGEGDSTFSVFPAADHALAAICAFQRALAAEPWPEQTPIRVRAALHTGAANLHQNDYNSSDVNRCARLRAIAHGGQTVISQTVFDLVVEQLPDGVTLKDMGLHRLKDLSRPEHVYQLLHPDLPAVFPPLGSLSPVTTNLPVQTTSFIGREEEREQIQRLLETTHLLTLTGAGGAGKTRLALQVAADLVAAYADGVWLVELAALSDPSLVVQAVASALGLREEPGRSLTETLTDYLKPKTLLLVLDNCEHLVEACARLVEILLRACPNLKVVATSREALHIAGETTYRVPSLLQPDPKALPLEEKDIATVLLEYDAVRLFVERARSHRPDFWLNRRNGPIVAEICSRLDGIPLAIELAAARIRALTVEQIAFRLNDRFRLLTGGSRTALPRQQTLQALIDWSYDLLNAAEKLLLSRLSVFSGGWTLEAAERVCAGEEIEAWQVLDLLTSLVEKSLVLFEEYEEEGSGRYRLLETIRQYGFERLEQHGRRDPLWSRHLDYYLSLAEEAESHLSGAAQQAEWLNRLEAEHDNLRRALEYCQKEEARAEAGLRLAGALWPFWQVRGHLSEGRAHLAEALERKGVQKRTLLRAKALQGAGVLAALQSDYDMARTLFEESLAVFRDLGNKQGIATVLNGLGNIAQERGDYSAAGALHEESLAIERELGNKQGIGTSLINLGVIAFYQGDYSGARALYEECLAISEELDDEESIAYALHGLGNAAYNQGDYSAARTHYENCMAGFRKLGDERGTAYILHCLGNIAWKEREYGAARALYEECLAMFRELGDRRGAAHALNSLGNVAYDQGDYSTAGTLFAESLALFTELGEQGGIAELLEAFASLRKEGQPERAVALWGAAEALREAIGSPLPSNERQEYDRTLAAVREALGEEAFAAAWQQGRAMPIEQAITYALEDTQS